ncbi:hypothetical protein H8E07_17560 [bacterium]|nr:hypothetical protein [bacterium]
MRNRNRTPVALSTALCLLILAAPAAAERNGGEFRVGVGAAPVQTLFELFSDVTVAALFVGELEPSTESEQPAGFIEYVRPMGERSRMIVHFNINSYEKEYVWKDTGQLAGKVSDDFYTLMMGAKHYYVRTNSFGLYLDAMAGLCLLRSTTDIDEVETDNHTLLAYQFTPLGMRIGGAAALDLAVGLGYKGILSVGFDYEF